jgi:hypothetical protein
MMKEYEARCLVEQWVREYSPFKAEVVNVRPGSDGAWVVVVECSTELSAPLSGASDNPNASGEDERSH